MSSENSEDHSYYSEDHSYYSENNNESDNEHEQNEEEQQDGKTKEQLMEEALELASTWGGKEITIRGVGGVVTIPKQKENDSSNGDDNDDDIDKGQENTNSNTNKEESLSIPNNTQVKTTNSYYASINSHKSFHVELLSNDGNNRGGSGSGNGNATSSSSSASPHRMLQGVVAFRLTGTKDMYLTNIMYGDSQRQILATVLAGIPNLLVDHIGTIIDYAMGRPSNEDNFEGPGFNYSPMIIQKCTAETTADALTSTPTPNKLQMFRLEHGEHGFGIGIRSLFGTFWRSQHWDGTISQSPHCLGDETWYFQDVVENY